ncbi:MAG: C1 family peptidase [Bacteroidales bacterium]
MKKLKLIGIIYLICLNLFAQPTTFSWALRHGYSGNPFSYISPAKDQVIQGPCHAFASVAAVEAMAQIYYNKLDAEYGINLSERLLYNSSGVGVSCTASSVTNNLNYFIDYGVIDEASFQFPGSCSSAEPGSFDFRVTIPRYLHFTGQEIGNDNINLKKAILDYGPLIVCLDGTDSNNHYAAYYLYGDDRAHSFLLLGWGSSTNSWHIKDSWPNSEEIDYIILNLFNFSPDFYRIDPDYNSEKIETNYGTSEILDTDDPVDGDHDGLYNWGVQSLKPSGWSGISLMDFDDGNPNTGFMYNYVVYNSPVISGSNYICSGGTQFTLTNIPQDLQDSVSWAITPANYCSPSSGNGITASFSPSSYLGKNLKITFTLSYNGSASFEKNFTINGPREDMVSISVLDSYGTPPPNYSGTYYVCPNTNYTISYNNNDGGCTTYDFDWDLPYGWSTNWEYNSSISINTGDYPYAMVDINAKTSCCSPTSRVRVYSAYFAEGECDGFFILYPNPSADFAYLDINKNKIAQDELATDQEFIISLLDRSGSTKYSSKFKGFPYMLDTSQLPKGIYFLNISYGNKKSTIRFVVEH